MVKSEAQFQPLRITTYTASPSLSSEAITRGYPEAPAWEENIGSPSVVRVVEYSPSGRYVSVHGDSDRDQGNLFGGAAGWYPVERIVVKEVLGAVKKPKRKQGARHV